MKIYKFDKTIKEAMDIEFVDDKEGAPYFRGISREEYEQIKKDGKLLPSTDLIPFDSEVIKYSLGDEYYDMNEYNIDNWLKNIIPWYDGSMNSVQGGVNLTNDFYNAQGYGDIVVALEPIGEVEDISDAHAFARSPSDLNIVGFYDVSKGEWI